MAAPSKTIIQYLLETARKNADKTAVKFVKDGRWRELTWKEYLTGIEQIAGGLVALGVQPQMKVAIMSNTRFEWAQSDYAIMGLGAVSVPIYQSSLPEDAKFILNNSETYVLICENQAMVQKWKSIAADCPGVKHIITFDALQTRDTDVIRLEDLKKKGEDFRKANPNFFYDSVAKTSGNQVATICYTSGTTGLPKGVVLTHRNIESEIIDVFSLVGITPDDVSITFLPFAHILARAEHFGHAYAGFTMGYAENIDRLRANLQDIRPTFLIGVPRIFEKIYAGIIAQADASPVKSKIFKWAIKIGKQVSAAQLARKTPDLAVLLQYQVAKKLVFDKLAQRMGGRLRFCVSGGAPLSREIAEFFHAAGLLILEGYGLTETTAAVFLNAPYDYKFGSVGKALADVQLKIAEDGEILVKSDKVMKEYYKDEAATKEVLNDGWFATGDIGELDSAGFLKITDRKKDLIKTAGGKFVAPQKIENLLKLSKYVSNVLVHGDKRKYVVTLVTLNFENVEAYAKENTLSFNDRAALAENKEVRNLIREVVNDVNAQLASWESIKNFAILPSDFTVESGELTPSLKVKRKVCDKKYKDLLDSLYGGDSAAAERPL